MFSCPPSLLIIVLHQPTHLPTVPASTTPPCSDTAYFHSWNHVPTGSLSVSSHILLRGSPCALSSSSASTACGMPSTPHHGLTTTSGPNAFRCTIIRLYSVVVVHVPSYFHLSCGSHFIQPEHSSTRPMPLGPLVNQSTSRNFSFPLVSMVHSATAVGSPLPFRPYREVRGLPSQGETCLTKYWFSECKGFSATSSPFYVLAFRPPTCRFGW